MVPQGDTGDEEQSRSQSTDHNMDDRVYIGNHLDELRDVDSEFFEAYANLSEHSWDKGFLDPKIKEFINVAISSATTALYTPATREHIGRALDRGATFEEVQEILELVSILGMHSATEGFPILVEEADSDPNAAGSEASECLINDLEEHREFFSAVWDDVLAIVESDPQYWEYLFWFLRHPYNDGILDPKVMEFLYIAIDVGTSHLYTKGLQVHIRNALLLGATPEEIGEVIELASATGIHSVAEGLPVLLEEAAKRDSLPESLQGHVNR